MFLNESATFAKVIVLIVLTDGILFYQAGHIREV
jgi:hypothetical protein